MENELRDAIKQLRILSEQYENLDADDRKKIRAALYRKEGSYAKEFFKMFHQFVGLNMEFGKDDS